MAAHPDEAHIKARQEKYRQAINSRSIDETLSFFSEDVHFSDFGISRPPRNPYIDFKVANLLSRCRTSQPE
jgi:hypothetical protein